MIKNVYTNKTRTTTVNNIDESIFDKIKSFVSSVKRPVEPQDYPSAGGISKNHFVNRMKDDSDNPFTELQFAFKGTNFKDLFLFDYSNSKTIKAGKDYIDRIFLTHKRIANTAHDDIVNIFVDHIESLFQKKTLVSILARAEDHIGSSSKEYVLYLTTKQGEYKVVIGELNFFIDNGQQEIWYKNNDPKGLFRDGAVRKFVQGIVK